MNAQTMMTRCLACGTAYPSVFAPTCPARALSPHDDAFLNLVAKKVTEMGAENVMVDPALHRQAIEAATLQARASS